MKRFWILVCSLALLTGQSVIAPAFAATTAAAEHTQAEGTLKINISGRQRMLSQRMAKAVCFAHLRQDEERHLLQAVGAKELFDKSLLGLGYGDEDIGLTPEPDQEIIRQLGRINVIWDFMKTSLYMSVESTIARGMELELLATAAGKVKAESNVAVSMFEEAYGDKDADPGLARTVNIAGRQRMLSQKAALEFCLVAAGVEPELHRKELRITLRLFDTSLTHLRFGNPEAGVIRPPSNQIRAQLGRVSQIWDELLPHLRAGLSDEEIPLESIRAVVEQNDNLLKTMNKAVGMY